MEKRKEANTKNAFGDESWELPLINVCKKDAMNLPEFKMELILQNFRLWYHVLGHFETQTGVTKTRFQEWKTFLAYIRNNCLLNVCLRLLSVKFKDGRDVLNVCQHLREYFTEAILKVLQRCLNEDCQNCLTYIIRAFHVYKKAVKSVPITTSTQMLKNCIEWKNWITKELKAAPLHPQLIPLCLKNSYKYGIGIRNFLSMLDEWPLPMGSHFPLTEDLGAILDCKRCPAFPHYKELLASVRPLCYSSHQISRKYEMADLYILNASRQLYARFSSILVKSFTRGGIFQHHLKRVEAKFQQEMTELRRFSENCRNLAAKTGKATNNVEAYQLAHRTFVQAVFMVDNAKFKLRLYMLRRMNKVYDYVLKRMKTATKVAMKLTKDGLESDERSLRDIEATRKFWKKEIKSIQEELAENKSLKLIINLEDNDAYFLKQTKLG